MRQSFEEYKSKFSSKTRSTLNRKIRKYAEHCGGNISWKVYKSAGEMPEFFRLARTVSEITYQEKLLDAGLPDSEEFLDEMEQLAQQGHVRGFILFHQDKPVSYLYCPVVQWGVDLCLSRIRPRLHEFFGRHRFCSGLPWSIYLRSIVFRFFDFTEGQSEHKKLFATHIFNAQMFFSCVVICAIGSCCIAKEPSMISVGWLAINWINSGLSRK